LILMVIQKTKNVELATPIQHLYFDFIQVGNRERFVFAHSAYLGKIASIKNHHRHHQSHYH
jgi:hypothetical protein